MSSWRLWCDYRILLYRLASRVPPISATSAWEAPAEASVVKSLSEKCYSCHRGFILGVVAFTTAALIQQQRRRRDQCLTLPKSEPATEGSLSPGLDPRLGYVGLNYTHITLLFYSLLTGAVIGLGMRGDLTGNSILPLLLLLIMLGLPVILACLISYPYRFMATEIAYSLSHHNNFERSICFYHRLTAPLDKLIITYNWFIVGGGGAVLLLVLLDPDSIQAVGGPLLALGAALIITQTIPYFLDVQERFYEYLVRVQDEVPGQADHLCIDFFEVPYVYLALITRPVPGIKHFMHQLAQRKARLSGAQLNEYCLARQPDRVLFAYLIPPIVSFFLGLVALLFSFMIR